MIDREKVIKGLELCNFGYDGFCDERECPYYQHGCPEGLRDDILALLKEQEEIPLRCKKCSYHREDGLCSMHRIYVAETDYCSLGAWEGR